jgi:hypothetical protein
MIGSCGKLESTSLPDEAAPRNSWQKSQSLYVSVTELDVINCC